MLCLSSKKRRTPMVPQNQDARSRLLELVEKQALAVREECIFSFEETHLNISLAPDSGAERSERITRLRNAMQRAEVILESGTVEAMTSQEVQKEIDAWRSERSESAMASILRGPLAAEVKAAMSSPSTPLRVYYKESP